MEISEERKDLYARCRDDLLARQLSNSENFDKAILSLSSAGLGISLAFIKDIVPITKASYFFLLHLSWYFFVLAIISTIISFITSQKGINTQLKHAEEYYLKKNECYLNKPNHMAIFTTYLNNFSGIIFIVAIFSTVLFVSLNISAMEGKMIKDLKEGAQRAQGGIPISKMVIIQDGATVPIMQKAMQDTDYKKKGATIPDMQPVSTGPKTTNSTEQSGGGKQGSGSNQSSGEKK